MNFKSEMIIDRAKGCLVGLALGDDNGGPTAMMMKNLEIVTHIRTLMPQYFGKGYLEWFKKDGYDAGLVTHKVLELVDSGMSFNDAAIQADKESDQHFRNQLRSQAEFHKARWLQTGSGRGHKPDYQHYAARVLRSVVKLPAGSPGHRLKTPGIYGNTPAPALHQQR